MPSSHPGGASGTQDIPQTVHRGAFKSVKLTYQRVGRLSM